MPENLVHCQKCRTLLNPELEFDSVEIPEFIPLQEIESMVEVEPNGYYVACPICERELRINSKYVGSDVACNFCHGKFRLDLSNPVINLAAFYSECPHCQQELRAAVKYLGMQVACKNCSGKIHLVSQ